MLQRKFQVIGTSHFVDYCLITLFFNGLTFLENRGYVGMGGHDKQHCIN